MTTAQLQAIADAARAFQGCPTSQWNALAADLSEALRQAGVTNRQVVIVDDFVYTASDTERGVGFRSFRIVATAPTTLFQQFEDAEGSGK